MKQLLPCLLGLLLSSCALKYDSLLTTGGIPNIVIQESSVLDLQSKELKELPDSESTTSKYFLSADIVTSAQRNRHKSPVIGALPP